MSKVKMEKYAKIKKIVEELDLGDKMLYEWLYGMEKLTDSKDYNQQDKKLFEDLILVDTQGCEAEDEKYWIVLQFPNVENIMIRFNAEYRSYNGAEYYGMDLVEPREVKVIKYFKID